MSEQQKATVAAGDQRGEKEEMGLERHERGRACSLKVLRRTRLSTLCARPRLLPLLLGKCQVGRNKLLNEQSKMELK